MESGTKRVNTLKQPPAEAAYCIARNTEKRSTIYTSTVRPLPELSGMEVLVRVISGDAHTILVAHLRPADAGSSATTWMGDAAFGGDDLLQEFLSGC